MIGLSFLPVAQTFVFTMGDSIISLEGEPRSFPSRKLACEAANRKGLKVSKGNVVSVEKEHEVHLGEDDSDGRGDWEYEVQRTRRMEEE